LTVAVTGNGKDEGSEDEDSGDDIDNDDATEVHSSQTDTADAEAADIPLANSDSVTYESSNDIKCIQRTDDVTDDDV